MVRVFESHRRKKAWSGMSIEPNILKTSSERNQMDLNDWLERSRITSGVSEAMHDRWAVTHLGWNLGYFIYLFCSFYQPLLKKKESV